MTTPTRVTLRPGERIFINGAVLKSDGRATFEILNDVPYLTESEIMHAQQTVTPLRQLYYILQTMIIEPTGMEIARGVYDDTMRWLPQAFANPLVLAGLETISQQVAAGSPFNALKTLRALIPIEDAILGANRSSELRVVGAG
ncbi:flagellar biosynthesis repressor FlbT [Hyphomicrobium sp.]|uniref:flagellar biosynthesis repressor FlbT n=1 Tax=Hyphomicrobium sp. TaxID=82 RepID=UPI002E36D225|nr:flagellar biosynthesis repressor FlbT [Hyphomicrobium sp.]HEX2841757.1 flagellar biosynthesis repressor FlbT [Hyphomicrobium sp.]